MTAWIADDDALKLLGMQFNFAAGTLSGTPTASGTANFIAAAADSAGPPRQSACTLINFQVETPLEPSLGVETRTLPDGKAGKTYTGALVAHGGGGPGTYTWAILSAGDSLPSGLILNASTGEIGGTPVDRRNWT